MHKILLRIGAVVLGAALIFGVYYYTKSQSEPGSSVEESFSSEISSETEPFSSSEEDSSSEESSLESSEEESSEESSEPEVSSTPESVETPPSSGTEIVSSATEVPTVQEPPPPQKEETAGTYYVRTPVASGTNVYSGGGAEIDYSNCDEGYIMVRYNGGNSKVRVQVTRGNGTTYTYVQNTNGRYEVFPLSEGSGTYTVNVFENISGNSYALALGASISCSLNSSFSPFLYPNQYVNFYDGSATVSKGARLSSTASNDLQIVENVYNYVIHNISYDFGKANQVSAGQLTNYLPSVDNILSSGYGICFDYAAVMATMLRTQGIPAKMVLGYAGNIYHAWISTYISDVGWVNGIIYFDGQSWKRMDPTFASSGNQSSDIMNYIGNGSNYNPMYQY